MEDRKRAALGAALRNMFGRLEARGVPEHLRKVVEQLDDADEGEAQSEGARPNPAAASPPEPPRR